MHFRSIYLSNYLSITIFALSIYQIHPLHFLYIYLSLSLHYQSDKYTPCIFFLSIYLSIYLSIFALTIYLFMWSSSSGALGSGYPLFCCHYSEAHLVRVPSMNQRDLPEVMFKLEFGLQLLTETQYQFIKQSKAGLNSEFSFSNTCCLTEAKEPSVSYD